MKSLLFQSLPRDILCFDTTDFLKEQTTTIDMQHNPEMPGGSYRLEGVYQKVFGTENEPTIDRAETAVNMLLRILMNIGDEFITASKKQSTYFKDVYVGRWCHGHYIIHLHCVVTDYHCYCYSVHYIDSNCFLLTVIFDICTINEMNLDDQQGDYEDSGICVCFISTILISLNF